MHRKVNVPLAVSRKKPKTLSGIETNTNTPKNHPPCRKKPKTLSGIETLHLCLAVCCLATSRKKPKTLSGIETSHLQHEKDINKWPEKT